MLVLMRKEGEYVEITHTSGDVLRVHVRDIRGDSPGRGRLNLAFDDEPHNFAIRRPERPVRPRGLGPAAGVVA